LSEFCSLGISPEGALVGVPSRDKELSLIRDTILECMKEKELFKETLLEVLKDEAVRRATLSYVEDNEVAEAKKIMEAELGFKLPRTCGYQILLKLYIRDELAFHILNEDGTPKLNPDGTKAGIFIPDSARDRDKFNAIVGLVLDMGPEAYKGDRFKGIYCRPGDWVVLAKYEGSNLAYKDIPVQLVNDDRILMVIPDPKDVTPMRMADKI
jgi:co-chaperonin GroES (HSP10)